MAVLVLSIQMLVGKPRLTLNILQNPKIVKKQYALNWYNKNKKRDR